MRRLALAPPTTQSDTASAIHATPKEESVDEEHTTCRALRRTHSRRLYRSWADGCLTAYSSQRIAGGYGGGIATPSPNCYTDFQCTHQYYVNSAIECNNDSCVPGRCDAPATPLWCTGDESPWTQHLWHIQDFQFPCFYIGLGGGCWNLPRHYVTNWRCDETGTQVAYCYTTWYNDPGTRCNY